MSTEAVGNVPVWTIADRLAKAREFAHFTQAEMAAELRIGRRSIVRYEHLSVPPRSVVLAYAQVTGVPVWWLEGAEYQDSYPDTHGYPATVPVAA